MRNIKRRYDPNLLATLNMLGIASLLGFLYCLIVLLHGMYTNNPADVVLYLLWFGIACLSVKVMKQGDIFGAYALGIATIAITIYDLVNGLATIGGAVLGTIVMLIVVGYISTSEQIPENTDDSMATRLTN